MADPSDSPTASAGTSASKASSRIFSIYRAAAGGPPPRRAPAVPTVAAPPTSPPAASGKPAPPAAAATPAPAPAPVAAPAAAQVAAPRPTGRNVFRILEKMSARSMNRSLRRLARRHPMPILLIAAGSVAASAGTMTMNLREPTVAQAPALREAGATERAREIAHAPYRYLATRTQPAADYRTGADAYAAANLEALSRSSNVDVVMAARLHAIDVARIRRDVPATAAAVQALLAVAPEAERDGRAAETLAGAYVFLGQERNGASGRFWSRRAAEVERAGRKGGGVQDPAPWTPEVAAEVGRLLVAVPAPPRGRSRAFQTGWTETRQATLDAYRAMPHASPQAPPARGRAR
jgi:hypothetical protein